ncbi:DNA polymerase III subunit delta' [Plastoroseomonas arctica]|uniref:DNA polymerase III subunit delta n=1 Tax=Plastoroseomonas arctica TaxID=1509237 RepID=A0AAF1JYT1_9PROT|nr:DNA polymerase III subunit delta' [Plastoroseomonas arctica]MBR0653763.1 DNA polymerase III subunit delta' [Plastoroseomonas arctica]
MLDPRANPELIGHEDAAAALERAARADRLHHAWLIAGPEGVGKATLAYRFARFLLAGRPDATPLLHVPAESSVFRRIAAAAHADLLTIEAGTLQGDRKRSDVINVDAARLIPGFFALTAAEGGWRVVVVDGAELMNPAAANAILKVLEEPPPRAVLLLVSSTPGRLLPTIRSRTRRLDLHPLPDATLHPIIAEWLPGMAEAERHALARLSGGSLGRALQLAESGGPAVHAMVEDALQAPTPVRVMQIADRLAADRNGASFGLFFTLLRRGLAEASADAARGTTAPGWVSARPLADWAGLWDRLGRLAEETERLNLDRKQAVLTGLSWLRPDSA